VLIFIIKTNTKNINQHLYYIFSKNEKKKFVYMENYITLIRYEKIDITTSFVERCKIKKNI